MRDRDVSAPPAIEIDGLRKTFGTVEAVRNVTFQVVPGHVFCLVGPNGAGKTTTINCITGLEKPTGGTVTVLGRRPDQHRSQLFMEVGVQLQENSMYPRIKSGEALRHFARFYDDALDPDRLLRDFGLEKRRDAYFKSLSGGEKRKLCVALALIGNPRLLILDEPTSGLDPHARRALWSTLNVFRERGMTVLLTTHNIREAEEECDVVCLLERGEIIAMGAPGDLVEQHDLGTRVDVYANGSLEASTFDDIPNLKRVDDAQQTLRVYGTGEEFITTLTDRLEEFRIRRYAVQPAGLEDLYLLITGNPYAEESGEDREHA